MPSSRGSCFPPSSNTSTVPLQTSTLLSPLGSNVHVGLQHSLQTSSYSASSPSSSHPVSNIPLLSPEPHTPRCLHPLLRIQRLHRSCLTHSGSDKPFWATAILPHMFSFPAGTPAPCQAHEDNLLTSPGLTPGSRPQPPPPLPCKHLPRLALPNGFGPNYTQRKRALAVLYCHSTTKMISIDPAVIDKYVQ